MDINGCSVLSECRRWAGSAFRVVRIALFNTRKAYYFLVKWVGGIESVEISL